MRAHYGTYGHFNNVLYFDYSQTLRAFSFFNIRNQLETDVPRTTAVEDSVNHYIEILGLFRGTERFERTMS